MSSTEDWWTGGIDWDAPAGQLLLRFAGRVPPGRNWDITVFGSAPLQLTVEDLLAFRRVRELTGHPTEDELRNELQNAVDLFRPAFDHDSPNRLPDNVRELWRELFGRDIDVRVEIIEPALERRRKGFGEEPPDYKAALEGL
jgi:hypothetical protein